MRIWNMILWICGALCCDCMLCTGIPTCGADVYYMYSQPCMYVLCSALNLAPRALTGSYYSYVVGSVLYLTRQCEWSWGGTLGQRPRGHTQRDRDRQTPGGHITGACVP